jgi:hypothetical protein
MSQRSNILSRADMAPITDLNLRLSVLEQKGQYFRNPVKAFIATNGPAGYGARISFQIYLTKGLQSIEILRNTSRDFGSAVVLQSYSISEVAINKPISYYDHDKAIIPPAVPSPAYYWIRSIPYPSKFQPIVQGPQIVTIQPVGNTSITATNDPSNTTNGATVDSIDAGSNATIRIYGTGGVGTSWTRNSGYGATPTFPPGTLFGQAYTTAYYVMWTGPTPTYPGASYQAFTSLPSALPDNYVFVGKVTTVAAGGTGGSSGGGGGGRGPGGCCEVGTPLKFPPGSEVDLEVVPCEDWIEIWTDGRRRVRVHPDTLVSVFRRAKALQLGDLLELEEGKIDRLFSAQVFHRSSQKMVVRVRPQGTYYGGGLRLHNLKPI